MASYLGGAAALEVFLAPSNASHLPSEHLGDSMQRESAVLPRRDVISRGHAGKSEDDDGHNFSAQVALSS